MVGKVDYSSVPTSADLENNSNQKKYTVNQTSNKGVTVSKPLCVLMAIGALLLAVLVGLVVFFTIPRQCNGEKHPEALTKSQLQVSNSNKNNYNNSSDKVTDKADNKNNQIIVEDLTDERLPRSIEPTHYRIRILPDLENFTISGSVTMLLKVNEETNDIIFHINDIEIVDHSVTVKPKNTSSPLKISTQEYLQGYKYSISLNHKLKKDTEYELYLDYNGKLNKQLQGFYGSHYDKKIIASTQFSPTDARRAFPCFDEPSFKAKFTIVLGRPQDMNTLSNMPRFNSTPFSINSETWYWDEYPETPKMSTYLVAFIISDLKQAPVTDSLMKFWSRDKYVSQTAFAAEIGPKILRYYEDYFGTKFPLEKIDIVALPAFGFGAMENWGLITFRESSLLYDPESSTNDDKRTIATVLAHEIAHQWFGNLVTPKFWNDLWLKEGFADYMQYLGIDQIEPKWKFLEEFVPLESRRAMDADAFQSARPISLDEVKNSHEIRQLFDAISYSKGAAVIRMINFFLGDETFKKGLSNFLKKHQYSNADRQDLFRALTEEAHNNNVLNPDENVKTIMDSWVEKAGFPVVNAEVDYEQQKLTINQKRFYFLQKDEKSSWWVPISFTSNATDGNPNFTDTTPKYWLKGHYEIQIDTNITEGDWFLLNLQQTGYYIVNYNEQNWNTLSENIMEFPPSIRAQLISDSMDLARANLLKYDIPLYMIANMAVQDSAIMYIPTLTALSKMKYLSDILSTTPAFGLFEEYHKNIFQETYRKVILADTVDDYISRRIGTTVLNWSCRSPESRCTHMAKTQFREWIVSGKRVAHNLRNIVYCTAIREGGEIEWDFAYKQYLEAPSLNEENTILDALGCTKLRWLLSRYVDKILDDPSIRIQDADRIFESVVKNKFGTQIGFDFIRKNWDAIIEYHGQGFNIVSRMVVALGTQMSTEFELSELIRFRDGLKEKNKLGTTSRAFEKAIDNVKANVEWMEKNYQQVYHWLQNNRDLRTRIHEKVKLDRYLQETNRHSRRVNY